MHNFLKSNYEKKYCCHRWWRWNFQCALWAQKKSRLQFVRHLRRAIAALAKDTELVRKLFEYSFKEEGVIGSNKIGNILLTALVDIEGDYEK